MRISKIKYNSPSGFININKYIPPFIEVKDGFGFKGILAEDSKSGLLQCHICGKWFKQFGSHIRTHNLNARQYKERFGLNRSSALMSKKERLKKSAVMVELRKNNPRNTYKFSLKNHLAGNRKGEFKSIEDKNKKGTCDLQVTNKIIELSEELKKTPSLVDLKEKYGAGFILLLRRRYGSYISACKKIGLKPLFSNFNPKYSRNYFINKKLNNPNVLFSEVFNENEQRAFYRYFKSFREFNNLIERRLKS